MQPTANPRRLFNRPARPIKKLRLSDGLRKAFLTTLSATFRVLETTSNNVENNSDYYKYDLERAFG
jgi:hypothetical protein